MKKYLAILLALAMIFTVFAGCGSKEESVAETEQNTAAEPAETTAPAAETEKTAEPAETAEPVEVEAEDEAQYDDQGRVIVQLPITTEPVTFTWWQGFPPPMVEHMDGSDDNPMFHELEARTGIDIEWIDVPASGAQEKFQLLLGSGEYPDILNNLNMMYTGGANQALEDEVAINLMDYAEYMPNYMYYVNQPDRHRLLTTDDGAISQFAQVNDGGLKTVSYTGCRTEYLEEFNMEAPSTYDELHDYLAATSSKYGSTLYVNASGITRINRLGAGYGIATSYGIFGSTLDLPMYYVDGECRFGPCQPEFKEFLTMLSEWYAEGLLDPDFISNSSRDIELEQIMTERWSVFDCSGTVMETLLANADEGVDFRMTPLKALTKEETDETLHLGMRTQLITPEVGNSLTTQCHDVELCVQMFNYLYSAEGSELANFGIEGLSYTKDADGNIQYTDLILHNDEGLSSNWALFKYCYQGGSFLVDARRNDLTNTVAAVEYNNYAMSNVSNDYEVPTGMELSAEEGTRFNELYTTINTYLAENIPQFIMGVKSFDEYDEFVEWLHEMGIDECIEIYQNAYDRFMAR